MRVMWYIYVHGLATSIQELLKKFQKQNRKENHDLYRIYICDIVLTVQKTLIFTEKHHANGRMKLLFLEDI